MQRLAASVCPCITRRANSVPPFPLVSDARHIDDLINAVEAYYRNHELPPRFQISPAAERNDLDAQLAARGYEIETPVSIEIAAAHALPHCEHASFRLNDGAIGLVGCL